MTNARTRRQRSITAQINKPPLPPIAAFEHARAVADAQSRLDIITPELAAKGIVTGGKRPINTGGTPVARWLQAGKLSDTQALAIFWCWRLWDLTEMKQRTTASYDELIPGGNYDVEHRAITKIEADQDLTKIKSYFPAPSDRHYWETFENVCRWDEPAGVAGSRLCEYTSSFARVRRAHLIVCEVADTIATKERLIPNARIRVA